MLLPAGRSAIKHPLKYNRRRQVRLSAPRRGKSLLCTNSVAPFGKLLPSEIRIAACSTIRSVFPRNAGVVSLVEADIRVAEEIEDLLVRRHSSCSDFQVLDGAGIFIRVRLRNAE